MKLKFVFCFLIFQSFAFALVPNFAFQVNRNISCFHRTYYEKDKAEIYEELKKEIKASFGTISATLKEKAEFIDILQNLEKEMYHHKYMTPKFMGLWEKASEDSDKYFDSDIEILTNRTLELSSYAKEALKKSSIDFSAVFKFYDTELQESCQFKVFVCATQKSGSIARAFGKNIIVNFNYGHRSADLCAIVEQVCHTLSQTMRLSKKQSIKNHFLSHKSKNALAAYFLFEKIVDYTIGKLWIYKNLQTPIDSTIGKLATQQLESVAEAMLPAIEQYLKERKVIDTKFIDEFIRQIDLHFQEAHKHFDIMLKKISLIVENGIDIPECQKIIMSNFEIEDVLHEISSYTTVFIGNNLGHPALRNIQDKIQNKGKDFVLVTTDKANRLFIIIKTNNLDLVKKAIDDIKDQPTITDGYVKDLT